MFVQSGLLDEALAGVRAAVDQALAVDLNASSSTEVLTFLVGLDIELNRLGAAERRVVAHADQRGIAGDAGSRSTRDLLVDVLRINPYEAKRRAEAAATFGPRISLQGEVLEPVVPVVAAAVETGEVSVEHGMVIAELLDQLPGDIEAEHGLAVQHFLLEQARHVYPKTLEQIAVRLRDTLDQDGAEERRRNVAATRSFRLIKHRDGSVSPGGRWTPALATLWQTILDPLTEPRTGEFGEPDTRTHGERMHDAMLEAGLRLTRSGELPDSGGTPTTITVTITLDQLREAAAAVRAGVPVPGVTTNAYGDLLPLDELMTLATEAELIPVVFDDLGGILAYGRLRRFAPPGLRRALAARDKGCAMPGCTRSASWTEAHHVREWALGGLTNADELVLLCQYDHATFAKRGWSIEMINGVPWFIPPPWLDPDQKPRRNHAHDHALVDIPMSLTPELEPV